MWRPFISILALILHFFSFLLIAYSQTSICSNDPPINPFLADSPWPIFHRNSYAQSSTCIKGPEQADSLKIYGKTNIQGGTSPWTYLSDKYPSGNRVLLQSNATHIFKFVDTGDEIKTVDSIRIDFDPIASFGYSFLLARNKIWYSHDPKYDPDNDLYPKLFKISDEDTANAFSPLVVLDTFDFQEFRLPEIVHYGLNYDGHIVINTAQDPNLGYAVVGVISQDFEMLDTLQYITVNEEITHHNSFPIDENNSFYVSTTHRLIQFTWDGTNLGMGWEAPYDFVHNGPTGRFAEGSGTTPTLLGWGEGNDKLVVMSDGHAINNLVAFWREIPEDWVAIPGMDIHFADSIRLPAAKSFGNLFQSIENSPCAFGYGIGIAQFNGFLGYDCENIKGVQKIIWDKDSRQLKIDWVNTDINMNGVLTYSAGSNLVYGSGKESDCNYYYYGLDWDTGELALRKLLGPEGTFLDDPFYDAGNNNLIDEEGNIYFSGGASLIKVEKVDITTSNDLLTSYEPFVSLFPNPTNDHISFQTNLRGLFEVELLTLSGQRLIKTTQHAGESIAISHLPQGMYIMKLSHETFSRTYKFVKM